MRQRVRQFLQAGRTPTRADLDLAHEWLGPALFDLFRHQHPRDVVHGAATARWLLRRGHDDRDLITAAFVHDVGKGHQRRLDRVAYVLAASVRAAPLVASGDSRLECRRAVARSLGHAERGAAMLGAAGAGSRVVDLTRRHHVADRADGMLVLLQEADSRS